ncbi:PqqD family protein [Acidobacteriota bacterium]
MDFLEMKPVQNPDTAWRAVDEECIIITPRKSVATVLNPVGTRVWQLADGNRSVKEIIEKILDEYLTERDAVEKDIEEFLTDLEKRGLLKLEEPG